MIHIQIIREVNKQNVRVTRHLNRYKSDIMVHLRPSITVTKIRIAMQNSIYSSFLRIIYV